MSEKKKFTADRVAKHACGAGKSQSIIWDAQTPGLGLRATPNGAKSYIFETRFNKKTLRITIGDERTWSIGQARKEATELKAMTDKGTDPRRVRAELAEAAAAALAESKAASLRHEVTLGKVWPEYLDDRRPHWSDRHYSEHVKAIHAGGQNRTRSPKPTKSAPLFPLLDVRLVELDSDRILAWAKNEYAKRPSYARLAWRMLKAFLNWCAQHKIYAPIIPAGTASSKKITESLGKPDKKEDVLQKEQLPAWFKAVRQITNPVISAYLQILLLTGARREEIAHLKWIDVDFRWNHMTIRDKVEGQRVIPLTPYASYLLASLPRRNEWVFSSPSAKSGRLTEPRIAHIKALAIAGLPHVSLHGLRRSFATLSEWIAMPGGIAAQIQGHAPQGVREQDYIRRPLDLLRMWHINIEKWILEEAGVEFMPSLPALKVVKQSPNQRPDRLQ